VPLDVIGAILTAAGLGLAVFGVLRSSEWGWVRPKPGGPSLFGVSPTLWLILAGLLTIWAFFEWEAHVEAAGREPLVRASIFAHKQMTGGLVMFFFQYLVQAGLFFTIPLFLSVSLGLTALETGVRILPLSVTLLLAAVGVPRVFPQASPRRVVRLGVLAMFGGLVVLLAALDVDATAKIVTVPLLLVGLGIGALASQLGAVTVSAVPDEQSPDVGGLQNTSTNLGAALGTALAGSVLIAALSSSFLQGIENNPAIPPEVSSQASVQLASGVPFTSDADLQAAMAKAGTPPDVAAAALEVNKEARIAGLRAAIALLALIALVALFFTKAMPTRPPGRSGAQAGDQSSSDTG
jgi:hypothetical protein